MPQPLLPIGDEAPDFALPDQEGQTVRLSDFRGKRAVVLVFYPGDRTPLCTRQLCEFRDAYEQLQEAGMEVLGLNPFGEASHRKFVEARRLPFRLLVDRGGEVAKKYHAWTGWGPLAFVDRSVYLIDAEGKIRFARRGKPPPSEILAACSTPPQS